MGVRWIDGAERLGDGSIGGAMDTPNLPGRAVEHTVECPPGRGYFLSMAAYLIQAGTEPQVLRDPQSDSLGQFGPLDQSGRALKNAGSTRTNRTGEVCIQSEVCAYASKPWTDGFDPAGAPNYLKFISAVDSWGIPRTWPAGPPQRYPGDHDDRDLNTWLYYGGWFGHSQVPGNDHGDPGMIDTSKVPPNDVGVPSTPEDPNAFPGTKFFGPGRSNEYITRLGTMLVARGASRFYSVGPGPSWGEADRLATRAFQQAQGWSGTDADGFPGPTTWRLLVTGGGKDITPESTRGVVSLSRVIDSAKRDPLAAQGSAAHREDAVIVERALAAEGLLDGKWVDGSFGSLTVHAYAAWQQRLGYSGADANGVPGRASLVQLGGKHGFSVVS